VSGMTCKGWIEQAVELSFEPICHGVLSALIACYYLLPFPTFISPSHHYTSVVARLASSVSLLRPPFSVPPVLCSCFGFLLSETFLIYTLPRSPLFVWYQSSNATFPASGSHLRWSSGSMNFILPRPNRWSAWSQIKGTKAVYVPLNRTPFWGGFSRSRWYRSLRVSSLIRFSAAIRSFSSLSNLASYSSSVSLRSPTPGLPLLSFAPSLGEREREGLGLR